MPSPTCSRPASARLRSRRRGSLVLIGAWAAILLTPEEIEIDFPLTRQDLAEMTGTTLHTVRLHLAREYQWQRGTHSRSTINGYHGAAPSRSARWTSRPTKGNFWLGDLDSNQD
ncbi:MAG TPA: hypothetical protein VMM55_12040 [Thermohalobaculum sp.]|nr:hypothetical protein [Thermohalobaculum sp.]